MSGVYSARVDYTGEWVCRLKVYIVCGCCEEIIGLARKMPAAPGTLTVNEPGDIIMAGDGAEAFYFEALCDDCRETLYGDTGRYCHACHLLH